jgi:hypothetical protein
MNGPGVAAQWSQSTSLHPDLNVLKIPVSLVCFSFRNIAVLYVPALAKHGVNNMGTVLERLRHVHRQENLALDSAASRHDLLLRVVEVEAGANELYGVIRRGSAYRMGFWGYLFASSVDAFDGRHDGVVTLVAPEHVLGMEHHDRGYCLYAGVV